MPIQPSRHVSSSPTSPGNYKETPEYKQALETAALHKDQLQKIDPTALTKEKIREICRIAGMNMSQFTRALDVNRSMILLNGFTRESNYLYKDTSSGAGKKILDFLNESLDHNPHADATGRGDLQYRRAPLPISVGPNGGRQIMTGLLEQPLSHVPPRPETHSYALQTHTPATASASSTTLASPRTTNSPSTTASDVSSSSTSPGNYKETREYKEAVQSAALHQDQLQQMDQTALTRGNLRAIALMAGMSMTKFSKALDLDTSSIMQNNFTPESKFTHKNTSSESSKRIIGFLNDALTHNPHPDMTGSTATQRLSLTPPISLAPMEGIRLMQSLQQPFGHLPHQTETPLHSIQTGFSEMPYSSSRTSASASEAISTSVQQPTYPPSLQQPLDHNRVHEFPQLEDYPFESRSGEHFSDRNVVVTQQPRYGNVPTTLRPRFPGPSATTRKDLLEHAELVLERFATSNTFLREYKPHEPTPQLPNPQNPEAAFNHYLKVDKVGGFRQVISHGSPDKVKLLWNKIKWFAMGSGYDSFSLPPFPTANELQRDDSLAIRNQSSHPNRNQPIEVKTEPK